MKNKTELSKMTLSEASPYLKMVSLTYGLRLNRSKEFKMAKVILANLYCRELC